MVRTIYASALLVVLWINFEAHGQFTSGYQATANQMAERAATFFAMFSFIQLTAILLAGPAMIAGTIATERERRTIEYLFASQLSNAEIVWGKLAARLLHLLYLVAAGLPVLSMAMLMGGIEPAVLARVFVYSLMISVTVGAMSIAVSVSSPRSKDAMMRIYLILFTLLMLPVIIWPFMEVARSLLGTPVVWGGELIQSIHPFFVLFYIQSTALTSQSVMGVASNSWAFLMPSLVAQSIFSFVAIAWATRSVRRVHLKESGRSAKRRNFRLQLWRPKLGNHPLLWKELFVERVSGRLGVVATFAQALVVCAVIVGTLLLVSSIWKNATSFSSEPLLQQFVPFSMIMTVPLRLVALLLVAVRAASSMTAEKERDSWYSLLATPLTAAEIVSGKLCGSLYATRNVVLLLLFVWVWGLLFSLGWSFTVLIAMAEFLLACAFVALVGINFSLKCRTSLRATGATIATCAFVGGGYLFCCIPLMCAGSSEGMAIMLTPCLPFLAIAPELVATMDWPDVPGELVAAFVLGNIGYLIANLALLSSCIANFDRLSGRMHESQPRRPREGSPTDASSVIGPPEGS